MGTWLEQHKPIPCAPREDQPAPVALRAGGLRWKCCWDSDCRAPPRPREGWTRWTRHRDTNPVGFTQHQLTVGTGIISCHENGELPTAGTAGWGSSSSIPKVWRGAGLAGARILSTGVRMCSSLGKRGTKHHVFSSQPEQERKNPRGFLLLVREFLVQHLCHGTTALCRIKSSEF